MKIDYNSTENQEIKEKFVGREVYCCFSYEMDAVLKASSELSKSELPNYDDVDNMYYFDRENVEYKIMEEYDSNEKEMLEYANNPETFDRRCKNKPDFEIFLNSLSDDEIKELCEEFKIDISEEESKVHEIFEWWIVSEFLYKKLKNKGEPVLEWGNNYYWGRCTTGQAILLDHVISEICEEMEILISQKTDHNVNQLNGDSVVISFRNMWSPEGTTFSKIYRMPRSLFDKYVSYLKTIKVDPNDTYKRDNFTSDIQMSDNGNVAYLRLLQGNELNNFLDLENVTYNKKRASYNANPAIVIVDESKTK